VQAKVSGDAHSSYRGRGVLCNGCCADALDRVLGKALPREVAGRLQAGSAGFDDSGRPRALGLESLDGDTDELLRDSPLLEVVANESVPCSALGEHLGTPPRKTLVVDGSSLDETLHDFRPRGGHEAASLQAFSQLPLGQVSVRQGATGLSQRLVAAKSPPDPARPRPIELDAHIEPGCEHDLRRQRAPRLIVE
jgi:hypothetical protein